jgi:hypothetical protein
VVRYIRGYELQVRLHNRSETGAGAPGFMDAAEI